MKQFFFVAALAGSGCVGGGGRLRQSRPGDSSTSGLDYEYESGEQKKGSIVIIVCLVVRTCEFSARPRAIGTRRRRHRPPATIEHTVKRRSLADRRSKQCQTRYVFGLSDLVYHVYGDSSED